MKKIFTMVLLFVISLNTVKAQSLMSDSFNNATINSNWVFISPNPASYYQLNGKGELLLFASAQNGGSDFCSCSNFNAPRLLQKIDTANHHWRVETKIRFNPTNYYQGAGLLFQTSSDSSLGTTATRIIDRNYNPDFDGQEIGSPVTYIPFTVTITYLRAERDIDSIRVYYSSDSLTWLNLPSIADIPIYWAGISSERQPWDNETSVDTYAYFDYFLVDNDFIFPIKLLNFTATKEGSKNLLQWTTTQEVNSSYFNVERSNDGAKFTAIGQVGAAGNSSVAKNYSLVDTKPVNGTNYYRLKMMDKDGQFVYSPIRIINEAVSFAAGIYPNPVQNNLSLNFNSDKAETVQVEIVSNEGKVITTQQIQLAAGASTQSINTASLSNGEYYVRLVTDDEETELKFVKER